MKRSLLVCASVLFVLMLLAGCSPTGGPTGPISDLPQLLGATATPSQVRRGQTLVFTVSYFDPNGDLNGGSALIVDNFNIHNKQTIIGAPDISGEFIVSVEISPIAPLGNMIFTIRVIDQAQNSSLPYDITVTVLQ